MSRAQRFAFLAVAAVIAVLAVILIGGGGDDESDTATTTSETTPTPTPDEPDPDADATETPTATPTPTPTPTPVPLLQGGKVTKLRYTEDETVKFRVTSDVDEEVHVHGYDIAKDIPAGETVTVSFPADITGIFEIEYEHAGEQIGQLRVDPK
jgi:pyruvate/2-oxoglutarate dehydrogenase complex dihydrolipoamide acyltransferase (E2) component